MFRPSKLYDWLLGKGYQELFFLLHVFSSFGFLTALVVRLEALRYTGLVIGNRRTAARNGKSGARAGIVRNIKL